MIIGYNLSSKGETETALVEIKPELNQLDQAEVILNEQVSLIVANYLTLSVTDEQSNLTANDALTRLRAFRKQIDEKRKSHLKPLKDYTDNINARFRAISKPIDAAEQYVEGQILNYRAEINRIAAKEQERLQNLAERRKERAEAKGETPPIPEAVAPIVPGAAKSVDTDAGKVSFRTDWLYEIVDAEALPRMYLTPDTKKIGDVVRASKGGIQIPGVRIYSKEVPITRMSK